jgi:hypothetical protein
VLYGSSPISRAPKEEKRFGIHECSLPRVTYLGLQNLVAACATYDGKTIFVKYYYITRSWWFQPGPGSTDQFLVGALLCWRLAPSCINKYGCSCLVLVYLTVGPSLPHRSREAACSIMNDSASTRSKHFFGVLACRCRRQIVGSRKKEETSQSTSIAPAKLNEDS